MMSIYIAFLIDLCLTLLKNLPSILLISVNGNIICAWTPTHPLTLSEAWDTRALGFMHYTYLSVMHVDIA